MGRALRRRADRRSTRTLPPCASPATARGAGVAAAPPPADVYRGLWRSGQSGASGRCGVDGRTPPCPAPTPRSRWLARGLRLRQRREQDSSSGHSGGARESDARGMCVDFGREKLGELRRAVAKLFVSVGRRVTSGPPHNTNEKGKRKAGRAPLEERPRAANPHLQRTLQPSDVPLIRLTLLPPSPFCSSLSLSLSLPFLSSSIPHLPLFRKAPTLMHVACRSPCGGRWRVRAGRSAGRA